MLLGRYSDRGEKSASFKKNKNVKSISSRWTTTVTWKTENGIDQTSVQDDSYDFKLGTGRAGSRIKRNPKKDAEITVMIETKKWSVIKE